MDPAMREIEIKLAVDGINYSKLHDLITAVFADDICRTVEGNSFDIYYAPVDGAKAQFVRLRDNGRGGATMTCKSVDKVNNIDRIEIDIDVKNHRTAKTFLDLVCGQPLGFVGKKYHVFFTGQNHDNISIYEMAKTKQIFIEIECSTIDGVDQIFKKLLQNSNLQLSWCDRSLFEMFVLQNAVSRKPLSELKTFLDTITR
jgi:phosphoribosylformylglycinamidine (FGAM) synthase PurS component